jgi:mono/diheme cytochrome c family protein
MKPKTLLFISFCTISILSCHVKKMSNNANQIESSSINSSQNGSLLYLRPASEVYEPGNKELAAMQTKYKDVSLYQLQLGHAIYTQGACLKCHGIIGIYQFTEERWKGIVDTMAFRSKISEEYKDAVYKYVLSIKATQVK